MISAVVSGNLGKDCRTGDANGTPVVNFSIASRRWEKGGEVTDWVSVSFFGQRATKIAQYLTKGSRVCVRGSLHVRPYTHNGQGKFEIECRADDVELMGAAYGAGAAAGAKAETNGSHAADDGSIPF